MENEAADVEMHTAKMVEVDANLVYAHDAHPGHTLTSGNGVLPGMQLIWVVAWPHVTRIGSMADVDAGFVYGPRGPHSS